jgi:transcriptional regulator with XRE-family HTH domain
MDQHDEVRDFLRTRRARVTPPEVGLVAGGRRRVQGLRREEVALLAGMSVDYYAQLERGDLAGASDDVLEALARALRFDEAETSHLFNLARAAQPRPLRRRRPAPGTVRPSLQWYLDSLTATPVWIRDERMDLVATNALGRALHAPMFESPRRPVNNARFVFLEEEASRRFFPDWERGADDIVATLRAYAGARPHDKALTDLIGELVTASEAFRTRWVAHHVRHHRTGVKRIHHPVVGDLDLHYEALDLPSDPGWHMFAYSAPPNSPTDERLRVLASWAATMDREQTTPDQGQPSGPSRNSRLTPGSRHQ